MHINLDAATAIVEKFISHDIYASKTVHQFFTQTLSDNSILFTTDQIVKRAYLNLLISLHTSLSVDEVQRNTKEAVFHGAESGKVLTYTSHAYFVEIDMDSSNVTDTSTFAECISTLCGQSSFLGAKHLVILSRIDRMSPLIQNLVFRSLSKYTSTTMFICTCDHIAKCPQNVKSVCLPLNLCLQPGARTNLSNLIIAALRPEYVDRIATDDFTKLALMLALPSPLAYIGHMKAYIHKTFNVLIVNNDHILLREFIIKIGASCMHLPNLCKIIIDYAVARDCTQIPKVVALSATMQLNTILANKTIFALENYIQALVSIFSQSDKV